MSSSRTLQDYPEAMRDQVRRVREVVAGLHAELPRDAKMSLLRLLGSLPAGALADVQLQEPTLEDVYFAQIAERVGA